MPSVSRHRLFAALALCASPLAFAQQGPEPRRDGPSLRESIQRVERETGGEVLRADTRPFNGREVNRVKVLMPEGRVRVVTDDPRRRNDRERRPDSRSRDE
ncbi:PepSY domain-containing protein [Coralloluteibacterium thermophilus]|uniref:PepSY domain-containing protein n=1 Tax=Coralloluteibacterium thermophilum TaxID=2707049 RepID=A0ABV9NEH1_9GAMM